MRNSSYQIAVILFLGVVLGSAGTIVWMGQPPGTPQRPLTPSLISSAQDSKADALNSTAAKERHSLALSEPQERVDPRIDRAVEVSNEIAELSSGLGSIEVDLLLMQVARISDQNQRDALLRQLDRQMNWLADVGAIEAPTSAFEYEYEASPEEVDSAEAVLDLAATDLSELRNQIASLDPQEDFERLEQFVLAAAFIEDRQTRAKLLRLLAQHTLE